MAQIIPVLQPKEIFNWKLYPHPALFNYAVTQFLGLILLCSNQKSCRNNGTYVFACVYAFFKKKVRMSFFANS